MLNMKILYIGTVCDVQNYEKEISKYKVKPTVAPLVLETALVGGFKQNNADVDILTFPIFPAFPNSTKLFWGNKKETLDCGYKTTWMSAVNITGLKQKSFEISSKKLIEKWIKQNPDDKKVILMYTIFQPVAKSVIECAKKYNIPCFSIVADLPRDMYGLESAPKTKKLLSKIYVRNAEKIQGLFDGYIYLSRHMSDVINPKAPFEVMEGVADVSNVCKPELRKKHHPRAIMYAGSLNSIYGLDNLVKAFELLDNKNIELWFFGAGDYEKDIKKYASKDKRIKFFGRVSRDKILDYEKKASLLVNVRDCSEDYTKYSFSSKTIEYMLSGTPVLTTRLAGIPDEYFNYVFSIGDNNVETIKNELLQFMSCTDEELLGMGIKAQQFVAENKNACVQAKKVIDFINKVIKN